MYRNTNQQLHTQTHNAIHIEYDEEHQKQEWTLKSNDELAMTIAMERWVSVSAGAVDVPTFGVALEGLGAQVGDAVALEVLRPGEGLPTALLRTGEASVVVVLPGEERGVARGGSTCQRELSWPRCQTLKK